MQCCASSIHSTEFYSDELVSKDDDKDNNGI